MNRHPPRYNIPAELRTRLLDFTIAYLLERPRDLATFGISFFQRLKDGDNGTERSDGPAVAPTATGNQAPTSSNAPQNVNAVEGSRTRIRFPDGQGNENDESKEPMAPNARANSIRRKSVFAEPYDPETDKDEKPVFHKKSEEQRAALMEAVKRILIFRTLDSKQMTQVIDAMFEKKVKPNEYIIKQGEDGDNFYVIQSGKYQVFIQQEGEETPKQVAKYENSGSFGELALMYNAPRAATVQAETDGTIWALDRGTFRRVVLKNAYQKRKMYEEFLQNVPMLSGLENYEKMNIADALVSKDYKDKDVIITQGDAGNGMYFVESGSVKVLRDDGKTGQKELTKIAKGGYFGELALLTNKPRAATVVAVGPVKLAFLDVEAFERLLGPCMEIMKRNVEGYEAKLIEMFGSKSNITDIRWK